MKSIKYRQIRKGNLVYCMRCLNVFFYLYGSDYLLKTDLNTLQLFRQHDKYYRIINLYRIVSYQSSRWSLRLPSGESRLDLTVIRTLLSRFDLLHDYVQI